MVSDNLDTYLKWSFLNFERQISEYDEAGVKECMQHVIVGQ
jgi:hypothetical protein